MNILFLSQWFPFPANNGSKIQISQLLKGLSQVHQVTLFSFYDPKEPSFAQKESYPFCARVERVPWKPFNVTSRKATLGLFSLSPRSLLDTHSPEMEALISNAVSSGEFDLIIASQLTMASYFPVFGTLPAIFEEIELGVFIDQAFRSGTLSKRLRHRLTWLKLRRYFSHLLNSFSACTVVSEPERRLVASHFPQHAPKIEVLPNCISLDEFQALK